MYIFLVSKAEEPIEDWWNVREEKTINITWSHRSDDDVGEFFMFFYLFSKTGLKSLKGFMTPKIALIVFFLSIRSVGQFESQLVYFVEKIAHLEPYKVIMIIINYKNYMTLKNC